MKNKTVKYLMAMITLVLIFIWSRSTRPAVASAAESAAVGSFITPLLEFFVGKGAVTDHLVRKLAHFTEYAALGVLLRAILLAKGKSSLSEMEHAALKGLAVALTDESIQMLSEGRSAEVQDVLLDFGGVLAGMICMGVLALLIRAVKAKR